MQAQILQHFDVSEQELEEATEAFRDDPEVAALVAELEGLYLGTFLDYMYICIHGLGGVGSASSSCLLCAWAQSCQLGFFLCGPPPHLPIRQSNHTGDDGSGSGDGDGSDLDVGVEQLERIIVEDFGSAWVDAYEATVRAFQVRGCVFECVCMCPTLPTLVIGLINAPNPDPHIEPTDIISITNPTGGGAGPYGGGPARADRLPVAGLGARAGEAGRGAL